MPRFRLLCLPLGVIAWIGISSVASAQISTFGTRERGTQRLAPDDLKMMNAAAQGLYEAPDVANGSSTTWHNSRTGNGGVVTFDGPENIHGLSCRKLTYTINFKAQPDQRHYTVNWCKTADGSWKVG